MNKQVRKASFFAKAEGGGWKERFAGLMGKAPGKKPTAKLEIDDQGSGETMVFPDISDISEIAEGVTIEATDGTHVFETDGTVYTIEVMTGKVTSVTETPAEAPEALNTETQQFVEAVAEALEANDNFQSDATAKIEALTTQLAEALKTIDAIKKATGHKDDGMGGATEPKNVKIGGKTINLEKLNNLNK